MSGFSADWLALREPADVAARASRLTLAAADALASGRLRALDLATGSGANVRYLASRLPADQEWLLVDDDERLLETLPARLAGVRFDVRRLDLSRLDAPGIFDSRALVTASALLDLVSERWMTSLAEQCARVGAVVLFALSYDGRIVLTPGEDDDERVRDLVNRHQQRDKGFGPALGPAAAACAEMQFTQRGYRVMRAPSDWVLDGTFGELQTQLIAGWADAAIEMAAEQAPLIERWRARRLAHVAAGRSAAVVGHEDVLAIRD